MGTHFEENALADLPDWMDTGTDAEKLQRQFETHKGAPSALVRAVIAAFTPTLLGVVALSLVSYFSTIFSPILLRQTILGLQGTIGTLGQSIPLLTTIPGLSPNASYALSCSLLLFLNSLVMIVNTHYLFYVQPSFGARCRTALGAIIYDKTLRQRRYSDHDTPSGFIVNLLATDCVKVQACLGFLHSSWLHPLLLITAVALLYSLLGAPALMGTASLVFLLAGSISISKKQTQLRRKLSKVSDKRVGLTHETLVHIKAAKFQGWEDNLATKISNIRSEEVALSRAIVKLTAISSFASNSGPAIAMAITCSAAVAQGRTLDAATIFPMLSLFMMLRFALSNLPNTLFNLIEASVSLQRIQSFLETPDFTSRQGAQSQPHPIEMRDTSFQWSSKAPALSVPELTIAHGELVVIVGSVGSGKSALLLGLLGELVSEGGPVSTKGAITFVAQTPWIMSDSIRGNITCGLPFDEVRYQRAIQASALESDLANLPAGDRTEIGERGINLSGGQRQRVALARAVYGGGDIFLLDDPLSALDPAVANQVFQNLICGELGATTRLLVSHRLEFALRADRVIVIEDGRVIESGTPRELSREGSRFSQLLGFHGQVSGTHHDLDSLHQPSGDGRQVEQEVAEEEEDVAAESFIALEERRTGAIEKRAIREYLSRLAPGLTALILLGLFVARQTAALGADLWLARASQVGIPQIGTFVLTYLGLVMALCIIAYYRAMYILTRGLMAGVQSHDSLLKGVIHAPMRFFESNPVGRILNRFSNDLATIELGLPNALLDAGHCLFETAAIFILVIVIAPFMLLIVAPIAIGYIILQRMYRPIFRESQRLYSITLSPVFALLSESLLGIETIRASNLTASFERRFVQLLNAHNRVIHTQIASNRWLGLRLEALAATLILALGASSALGMDAALNVGFAGLLLSYASSMTSTMNWAIRCVSIVESNLTSFERIERYAHTPSERLTGELPPPTWPHAGEMKISSLTVQYRPELSPALKDIDCTIPSGSRVGIVGRSGSGKSTLILAIMRLLEPTSGHVEVDGINLSNVALARVRNALAVVPQEPILFSGALRESLDPFNEYSDDDVIAALRRVHLGSFFDSLPNGLQTTVREGGFNFSSGQRQLICLARALLRKSKIIVLDEATAAIDVETDFAIQQTIREELKSSTLLVIAHRLGTVLDSDLILVLQDGFRKEFDTPKNLLQKSGSILGILLREMQAGGASQNP
jgi:ABC-type multidrug transport system fused ATPase/permease subunit